MRIDLFAQKTLRLRIHGPIKTSNQLVSLAKEAVTGQNTDSRAFFAIAGYSIQSCVHKVTASIVPDEESNGYQLSLLYECPEVSGGELRTPPPDALRTTTRLETLLASDEFRDLTAEFHCDAHFVHPYSHISTIVPLPFLTVNHPDAPFSEIRGVRFAKDEGDSHLYSVSVDYYPRTETVRSAVQFHMESDLSVDMPRGFLLRATRILENFVVPQN